MKPFVLIFILLLGGMNSACSRSSGTIPVASASQAPSAVLIPNVAKPKPPMLQPGEVDAEGRLILHRERNSFIRLEDEFGLMLVNEGDEKHPQATFILGERATQKLTKTQDQNEFYQVLARLPRGSRIRRYDTCQVSTANGLPGKIERKLERKLAHLGHRLEEDPNITDTCQDNGR